VPQDAERNESTPDKHTLREFAHQAKLLMERAERREGHLIDRLRVGIGLPPISEAPTEPSPVRRPRKAAQNTPEREPAHEVASADGHELTSPISEFELRERFDARYAQEDALLLNFREQAPRPSAAPDAGPDLSR
jgi:hypothetical protein